MTPTDATAALRELAARFPIPEGRGHEFVDLMAACRRDFGAAIEAIESDPRAQTELERLIEADEAPGEPVDGAVGAALARLDALPPPGGQHPFLAEIVQTLAAMRLALHAVAASEDAARRFGDTLPS